jgi:hypothetical protein
LALQRTRGPIRGRLLRAWCYMARSMRSPATSRTALACALLCLSIAARAGAQGSDMSAPAGGRSALMGGTGVALGRDGAAPFQNPASIVRILDRRLAFSVNFYSFELSRLSDFHQPAALDRGLYGTGNLEDTSFTASTFHILPTTLCVFFNLADFSTEPPRDPKAEPPPQKMPRSKLALCFASLESEDVDHEAISFSAPIEAGQTAQVQSLQRRWNRVFIGPTYSTRLHEDFALGASLQVVYSRTSYGFHSTTLSDQLAGGSLLSTFGATGSGFSFDLTAVLGATYRHGDWTFGASARVPSLHLFGGYDATYARASAGGDGDRALVTSAEGSLRTPLPIRLALGAGLQRERWTLEMNAAFDLPIDGALHAELDEVDRMNAGPDAPVSETRRKARYEAPSHPTISPRLGAEFFLDSSLSLLTGASLSLNSLDALRAAPSVGNLVQARNHHLEASIGLGSYWNGGELLMGFVFDYAWGDSLAVDPYALPNEWSTIGVRSFAVTFVIAGATNLNAILGVVRRIAGEE